MYNVIDPVQHNMKGLMEARLEERVADPIQRNVKGLAEVRLKEILCEELNRLEVYRVD